MSIKIFPLLWLSVLAICVFPIDAHAQEWQLVESGVTSDLYDITFVNARTGWAVGADSTIIKTTDGGHTWFRQYGGAPEEYRCVFFRDSLLGWIGGTGGLVLHTTDGGQTWVRQETETITHVNDIDFVNDSTGWLAGSIVPGHCSHWGLQPCGAVLKTTDGGGSWVFVLATPVRDTLDWTNSIDGEFKSIDFVDEHYGFVGGSSPDDRAGCCGTAAYTTDGGATWFGKAYDMGGQFVNAVTMFDSTTIVAAGNGLTKSRDVYEDDYQLYYPFGIRLDMSCPDTNHVYTLCDWKDTVRVFYYTNGTREAVHQFFEGPPFGTLVGYFTYTYTMGLYMLDSTTGWVCGDSGRLWRQPAIVNPVDYPSSEVANAPFIKSIYPNPISATQQSTTLHYSTGKPGSTQIVIYDLFGRRVYSTAVANATPGEQQAELPLQGLKPGVYVVQALSGSSRVRAGYTKLLVR